MYFLTSEIVAAMGGRTFLYSGTVDQAIPALSNNVPGTGRINLKIDGGWHFFAERLTASYPTLYLNEDTPEDSGVCQLRGMFYAGTQQIALSNAFIPLLNVSTPGRAPVQNVTPATAPSTGLNIEGYPWPVFYQANGSIIVDLQNFSTVAVEPEQLEFTWQGWCIPVAYINGVQEFYDLIKKFGIERPIGL